MASRIQSNLKFIILFTISLTRNFLNNKPKQYNNYLPTFIMKKKEPITLHKNLQSGKPHEYRNNNPMSSTRGLDRQKEKGQKKVLSQQKLNTVHIKRSQSKASSKQSRKMTSSIAKNQKGKSKRKAQSVKGSKKTLKRHNSESQNSIASARNTKNIYVTNVKQKVSKKKSKLQQQQQTSLTSITESIKSQSQRLEVDHLVEQLQQSEFASLHKLKLHILNFIFRNRIIRDQQYNRLFELVVQKFPDKEELFKSILFEIVSSLDN